MNSSFNQDDSDEDIVFIEATPPKPRRKQVAAKSTQKKTIHINTNPLFGRLASTSSENDQEPCYSNFQSFQINSDSGDEPKRTSFKRSIMKV